MIAFAAFLLGSISPIQVVDAWSRPAIGTAVVYARIEHRGTRADVLTSASTPVAARVAFHESVDERAPESTMAGMSMQGGMLSMKTLTNIAIPAHGERRLVAGSYHLMLVGLRHDLAAGQKFALRLTFRYAGSQDVVVRVR